MEEDSPLMMFGGGDEVHEAEKSKSHDSQNDCRNFSDLEEENHCSQQEKTNLGMEGGSKLSYEADQEIQNNNNSNLTSAGANNDKSEEITSLKSKTFLQPADLMRKALQAAMAGHQTEPRYLIKAAEQSQKAMQYSTKIEMLEKAGSYELAHLWTPITYHIEALSEQNKKMAALTMPRISLTAISYAQSFLLPLHQEIMSDFMSAIEHGNKISTIQETEKRELLKEASDQAYKAAKQCVDLVSLTEKQSQSFYSSLASYYEQIEVNLKSVANALERSERASSAGDQGYKEQWNLIATQSQTIAKKYFQLIQESTLKKNPASEIVLQILSKNSTTLDEYLSIATESNDAAADRLAVEILFRACGTKLQASGDQQGADQWNAAAIQAQKLSKYYLYITEKALTEKVDPFNHDRSKANLLSLIQKQSDAATKEFVKEIKYIQSAIKARSNNAHPEEIKQWNAVVIHAQAIVDNYLQIISSIPTNTGYLPDYLSLAISNNEVAAECLERETSYIAQAIAARSEENQQVNDRWNALVIQAHFITERWIRTSKTIITEQKAIKLSPVLAEAAITALEKEAAYITQIIQAQSAGSTLLAEQQNAKAIEVWMAIEHYIKALQAGWAGDIAENQRLTVVAQQALAPFIKPSTYGSSAFASSSPFGFPANSTSSSVSSRQVPQEKAQEVEVQKFDGSWTKSIFMVQAIVNHNTKINQELEKGNYDEVRRLTQEVRSMRQAAEDEIKRVQEE